MSPHPQSKKAKADESERSAQPRTRKPRGRNGTPACPPGRAATSAATPDEAAASPERPRWLRCRWTPRSRALGRGSARPRVGRRQPPTQPRARACSGSHLRLAHANQRTAPRPGSPLRHLPQSARSCAGRARPRARRRGPVVRRNARLEPASQLDAATEESDSHVIISANEQLDSPVVATAWRRIQRYDAGDPEITDFVRTYRRRGPEQQPCDR
jgi:hypothetical protein